MNTYKVLQAGRIVSAYYEAGQVVQLPPVQAKYLVMQGRIEPLGAGAVAPKAKTGPAAPRTRREPPPKRVIQVREGEEF